MRKVIVRENQNGQFHLQQFGVSIAGAKGELPFSLLIESKNKDLHLEFSDVKLFDLFSRFDLKSSLFTSDQFELKDFVRVSFEANECVVEACGGALYDFFKERAASGKCMLRCARPISFYWRGNSDRDVA